MGMDIYLEAKDFQEQREILRAALTSIYARADKAESEGKETEWEWRAVASDVFNIMYSGGMGYYRCSYNAVSIGNWLACNIQKRAKGDWGLAIFYDALKDLPEGSSPIITSEAFRQKLLSTAKGWQEEAEKLRGKPTKVGYFGEEVSTIAVADTTWYVDYIGELVEFAEVAIETESPIYVSY